MMMDECHFATVAVRDVILWSCYPPGGVSTGAGGLSLVGVSTGDGGFSSGVVFL